MNRNKLLQRQIQKYFSNGRLREDLTEEFIIAVNNSYNAYEKDLELSAHAFKITEEDYVAINRQLQKEIDTRKLGITNLNEAIKALDDSTGWTGEGSENDLIEMLAYLQTQIAKRKKVEEDLKTSEYLQSTTAKRLKQLISNLQNGILVVDENGRIILANPWFCEMFGVDATSDELIGTDSVLSIYHGRALFKDPGAFTARVRQLMADKELVADDELQLVDGRIILRTYVPVYIDSEYKGHLWKFEDVTKDRSNREELQRLSLVASANENGVAFCNTEGTVFWTNEGMSRLSGYTKEEMFGKTPIDLFKGPLSDRNVLRGMIDDYQNARNFSVELLHYKKDGTPFWGRDRGQAVLDSHGKIVQYFAMVEDISREKESQSKLNEYEYRFKMAFEIIGDNLWEHDFDNGITTSSQRETRFLGHAPATAAENVNLWWESIVPGDKGILEETDRKYRSGQIDRHGMEYRLLHKDGSIRWVLDRGVVIQRRPDGSVWKIMGTHTDITHLKRTELELEQRVKQFQALSENIPGVIFEYECKKDGSEGLRYISPAIGKIFGIQPDQNYNILDYTHPDDLRMVSDRIAHSKETLESYNDEARLVIKDRGIVWRSVSMSFSYFTQEGSKVFTGFMLDTTERKNAEVALRKKEEKYRNIIANMNLGLMEVDQEGTITFANQAFCNMGGYAPQELMGIKAEKLFGDINKTTKIGPNVEPFPEGVLNASEISLKDKSGNSKWWLISSAPRYNDEGKPVGSIGIHLDITAQKNLEIDLIAAKLSAEESSHAKEVFLANMSHEIRTPLNAILGMSRQLQKTHLEDTQRHYLDTIHAAGENLLVIINDILDIAKVEAGKLTLEKIGFSLQGLTARISSVMLHKAEEKGLQLSFAVDERIHPILLGDPYRLNQILLNLLSNAIKFTEQGSVAIVCNLIRDAEGVQLIKISVSDTGIGMEKKFQSNLFQKFLQEDKTVARKYGGTGLGMSICKQLVELMDGTIEVSSEKGKGTEVRLCIPLAKGEEGDLVTKEEFAGDVSLLQGRKILLVEDNEMNRQLVIAILDGYGVTVEEVVNGMEAVEAVKKNTYDLVLMDVQMPVMDGREATRVIRAGINKTIPIIALTANAIKGEIDICKAAGMNDYISKPFEEEALIKMMISLLNNIDPALALYSLARLRKINSKSPAFIEKMLSLFIRDIPTAVQQIKDAYDTHDFETIAKTAHRIKPVLYNLCIDSLEGEIKQIEELAAKREPSLPLEMLIRQLDHVTSKVLERMQMERTKNKLL